MTNAEVGRTIDGDYVHPTVKETTVHMSISNVNGSNDKSCRSGGGSSSGRGGDSHGVGDGTRSNVAA